ncbi:flagellin [Clostridium collagenovorans DSM 3089]|uniref:Flagellin n=1 Tax=Clostridium collagenovorans DSM 3089 TaxID=1121306 RepID=A0A1M5WPZ9_9CLOT|nr:flagellin [Clostridium collagenovorans]SHH89452.1 flagellin [Clostridium collagenovorans DSM 3089]
MRINTNINAMTATNQAARNTALAGNSMGKLASGLRINKAGDDAAGLAISEKMRSQIRGMEQANRNTQDGVSLVQTAEGATEEIGNIVQRMRELSVQASNETNTAGDRTKITEELTQLHSEIDRIADSTQFNGKTILNGATKVGEKIEKSIDTATGTTIENFVNKGFDLSTIADTTALKITTATDGKITMTGLPAGSTVSAKTATTDGKLAAGDTVTIKDSKGGEITFNIKTTMGAAGDVVIGKVKDTKVDIKGSSVDLQVGANTSASESLNVKIINVNTTELGLTKDAIAGIKAEGTAGTTAAKTMIDNLDKALETLNTSRANLGAMQNRLEATSSNLTTSTENLSAAESRIRDVDVAKEMINLSKLNLLSQASQAMVMQAKQQPESVMQLLR